MIKSQRLRKRPDDPPLAIRILPQEEGICLVECAGEINIRTAARFGEGLRTALRAATRYLIVDLRQVTRMDSVGIGRIVDAGKRLLPGSRLHVRLRDPRLRMLLQIAGIGDAGPARARGAGAG